MASPLDNSFGPGDIIQAAQVKQFVAPIQGLEEGQAFFRQDVGTANAFKVDFSGTGANKNTISAYQKGQLVIFKAANANTGAATLQIQGPSGALTAVPLVKPGNTALANNDIKANQIVAAVYNEDAGGTNGRFEMIGAPATSQLSAAQIGSGSVNDTEFGYLDGVTSPIQTQLNGKAASSHTHAAADIVSGQLGLARGGTGADLSASGGAGQVLKQSTAGGPVSVSALSPTDMPSGIDAAKIGGGVVSNAEFGYLDGVTSPIQTQLNGKAASSHTHAAADITTGQLGLARGGTGADLSASGGAGQVLKQSTAGGPVSVSALSATDMPSGIDAAKIGGGVVSNAEFAYLDGVTSPIQTQLNGKAASSHTHAAADIISGQLGLARGGTGADLSASGGAGQVLKQSTAGGAVSVGALAASDMPSGIDAAKIGGGAVSNAEFGYLDGVSGPIQTQLDGKAPNSHTHAAADITSGQLGLARGGTGADLSASGGAGQVLKQSTAGGPVSVGALSATDMPSGIDAAKIGSGAVSNSEFGYLAGVNSAIQTQLDATHNASNITSGQLSLARGGTGADLSLTGGSGQVLKQSSAGGAVSVGALVASDMPSGIDATKIGAGSVSNAEFGYLDGVTSSIQTQLNVIMPIGSVMSYAGSAAPTGWLLCYGQNVSRTTYSALFAKLGTVYGAGDGSTTFTLPDLRGRVIAGQDNMGGTAANRLSSVGGGGSSGITGLINGSVLGASGGADRRSMTSNEMPLHSHAVANHVHQIGSTFGASTYYGGFQIINDALRATMAGSYSAGPSASSTGSSGSGQAYATLQPTIVLNYIIYAGV